MCNVCMKCVTSVQYARLVLALLRLANHTSSSGISANASTLTGTAARCLDTTTARVSFSLARLFRVLDTVTFFVVLFVCCFFFIADPDLIRDNRVYHVLNIAQKIDFTNTSYAHPGLTSSATMTTLLSHYNRLRSNCATTSDETCTALNIPLCSPHTQYAASAALYPEAQGTMMTPFTGSCTGKTTWQTTAS